MKKLGVHLVDEKDADVCVLGVLLGKASRKSVETIREQSWHVEFFDVDRNKNLFELLKIADLGDIEVKKHTDITNRVAGILKERKLPFLLGGNHQLSLYALKAFKKMPRLIIFDAHTDIYDSYMDEKVADSVFGLPMSEKEKEKENCATWVRRFIELSSSNNVAYFGIRSAEEDAMKFMLDNSVAYFTPKMLRKNPLAAKRFLSEFTRGQEVYVTVDIDFFDPAVAPAVYHPEPNGHTFPEFQELLSAIEGRIVGADVVELKPIPENFVTEFLAIKVIFEMFGKINDQVQKE